MFLVKKCMSDTFGFVQGKYEYDQMLTLFGAENDKHVHIFKTARKIGSAKLMSVIGADENLWGEGKLGRAFVELEVV